MGGTISCGFNGLENCCFPYFQSVPCCNFGHFLLVLFHFHFQSGLWLPAPPRCVAPASHRLPSAGLFTPCPPSLPVPRLLCLGVRFLVLVIPFLACFQPFLLLFITYLFHLLIWIPLPVGLIVSVPTSAQLKKNPELLSCLFGGSIETSFKSNIEYERFCTLEVQNVLCRERVWAGSELCADLERVSRGNSGNILSQKHPSKTGKLGVGGATRGFSSSKTGLNSPSRGVWWRGAGLWDHYWHFWCNTSAQVSKAACCVAGWLIWTRAGCFFWNFHCSLSCFVRPCVIIMCGVCVKLSAGALSSLIMCVVH